MICTTAMVLTKGSEREREASSVGVMGGAGRLPVEASEARKRPLSLEKVYVCGADGRSSISLFVGSFSLEE